VLVAAIAQLIGDGGLCPSARTPDWVPGRMGSAQRWIPIAPRRYTSAPI